MAAFRLREFLTLVADIGDDQHDRQFLTRQKPESAILVGLHLMRGSFEMHGGPGQAGPRLRVIYLSGNGQVTVVLCLR